MPLSATVMRTPSRPSDQSRPASTRTCNDPPRSIASTALTSKFISNCRNSPEYPSISQLVR